MNQRLTTIYPLLLFTVLLNFTNAIAQASRISDTTTFMVKARLVEVAPPPAHCGIVAWALAQKFEIIESAIPDLRSESLIGIQPCPESLGEDFFTKNKIYLIAVGKKTILVLNIL